MRKGSKAIEGNNLQFASDDKEFMKLVRKLDRCP